MTACKLPWGSVIVIASTYSKAVQLTLAGPAYGQCMSSATQCLQAWGKVAMQCPTQDRGVHTCRLCAVMSCWCWTLYLLSS